MLVKAEELVGRGYRLAEESGTLVARKGDELIVLSNEEMAGIKGGSAENVTKVGVSKYGQTLSEIGEVLENGMVKGKYSQRIFDPNNAGGPILKK